MFDVGITPILVLLAFFIIAFTYASVGMGGGSSYTALLAIFGFSVLAIPMISLILNLFATTISSFNYIRHRHARFRLIFPFIIASIPMAYLGGALVLPKGYFYIILLISLVFVAARIYLWDNLRLQIEMSRRQQLIVSLLAGALLGLLAGIVGIGGGVYLVPLIIALGLGSEKQAAACGVIFIWVNSASGLASRLQYNSIDLAPYTTLIVAVILGSALGSWLGAAKYQPRTMQKTLGVVILVAIGFLVKKLADLQVIS